MAEEESLVSRRPKRSTAGNRMELALAELALEQPHEVEEDVDFVVEKDEEDVFESDFASTDEEAAQEDVDEGDKAAREDERRERKTARARVEKATAAAHARQRVTFNPEVTAHPRPQTQKPRRRVSLGVAVNAETGEVIEGGAGMVGAKRQSKRRHTVMNTSATVNRIKDAEVKRAAIPKKTKMVTRLPTQDELIARALDTEEGNITEHRDYLRLEEEKRAKARVVKQAIEGPVLRWISKKETAQVEIPLPPPPLPPPTTTAASANLYSGKYSFVYTSGAGAGSQAYSMPFYAYTPFVSRNAASNSNSQNSGASALATATAPSSSQVSGQTQVLSSPVLFTYPPTPTAPFIAHRTEDVCKNYVIHEVTQSFPYKPPWNDTMSAMFGDHVQWDEVKVFTGKGRPLSRPVRTCLITGLPAKYCDPRTNVPFANVGAYETLTKVIGREYVWCSALGCYVGMNEPSWKARRPGRESEEGPRMTKCMGTNAGAAVTIVGTGLPESAAGETEDVHIVDDTAERTAKRRRVEVAGG